MYLTGLPTLAFGVSFVNVHYMAAKIEAHVAGRVLPEIAVSDERDVLLDTGGGVVRALSKLGADPFLIHNSDSVWIEGAASNIVRLAEAWDPDKMDGLMLLAERKTSLGYDGQGDFELHADGARFEAAGKSRIGLRLHRRVDCAPASL